MARGERDRVLESLERLGESVEKLFILNALGAGMAVEEVRALLGIDKHKVLRKSKALNSARKRLKQSQTPIARSSRKKFYQR